MKLSATITTILAAALFTPISQAVLVGFSYTQSDSATGSGTIGAFSYDDGGGPINFSATPMAAATVYNPLPGSTPAGYVGATNAQTGNSNEANVAVGLLWSGFVLATGTRGLDTYTIQIPLVFVPKQTQSPTDLNDYTWNVAFGDNTGGGNDVTGTALRFALYLSRDEIVDATETSNTFQRYTQQTLNFAAGADSLSNTDVTTAPIKDATDAGAPAGTDAAGRNLAFYYGWRDGGTIPGGTAFLVDTFTTGGLLDANPATLTLVVPEPTAGLLLLGAVVLPLRRKRR